MTPYQLRAAAELLDFHRCPNTGRVIHSHKEDDKSFCRCGRPNPSVPGETAHAHFKERMAKATVEEFVEQEEWGRIVDRHPIKDPTTSTFMWVDKEGTRWFRSSDGNLTSMPMPKDEK